MTTPTSPTTDTSPLANVVHACLIAGLGGAVLGAVDALLVIERVDVRYPQWSAGVALVGILATGWLGGLLALPSTLLALVLGRGPARHAATPGVCAGLGTLLGLAVFIFAGRFSMLQAVPLACGATLLCLVLREPLGAWSLLARATGPRALASLGAMLLIAACALLIGTRASYPGPARASSGNGTGPNVLHISIDTLRADKVGCYGYERGHTPNIDRLWEQGVLFEATTAQANTTGPSHTTQLTGLYPAEHGALTNGRPLHHTVRTLPEYLSEAGWDTAGFVSGFTLVDSACGLAPRFDWYDDTLLSWLWMPQACEELAVVDRVLFRLAARRGEVVTRADRPAGETIDRALAWLTDRPRPDAPFYAFVHLYDPHAPYEPPGHDHEGYNWYELSSAEREQLVTDPARLTRMHELHDAEVTYADEQIGRLIAALEAAGQLEQTLVILTSDHGEGFGRHGYWFDHGTFVYDEELHVPLILRLPASHVAGAHRHAGQRVAGQTRLLDLTPTILDLLDLAPAEPLTGTSLLPLIESGERASDRPSFALGDQRQSLRTDEYKLIWTAPLWTDTQRSEARYELFDLTHVPAEQFDLVASGILLPAAFEALRTQLDAWREATEDTGSDEPLDPEVAAQLRKLGYL